MPTPAENQIRDQIDLLLQLELKGMDPTAAKKLKDDIQQIEDEYETAVAKGKSSARYKDISDSIAKNLPAIVNGIYSADKAFKKGDYISGSAAIMSICAGMLPIVTTVTTTTGPVGVLIGALFSVVAQILGFFAPQQPSLESKIARLLDQLKTDDEIESIKGFGDSVSSYASSLRSKCEGEGEWTAAVALPGTLSLRQDSPIVVGFNTNFSTSTEVGQWLTFDSDTPPIRYRIEKINNDGCVTLTTKYSGATSVGGTCRYHHWKIVKRSVDEILDMPLTNESEADEFLMALRGLEWGLGRDQAKLDTPVFCNWKVAEYLKKESNQSKEGWPEVLGLWCQTYIELLTANIMLRCMVSPGKLEALLVATQASNKTSRLSKADRARCHDAVLNLGALMKALPDSWESDRKKMLAIVTGLRPVARERGLYARIDGRCLYVARGNGKPDALAWDYKRNTVWIASMSIHTPKNQIDSFTPKYELLMIQDGIGSHIERHTLDSVRGDLSDGVFVISPKGEWGDETSLDVCGLPFNDGTPHVDAGAHPKTLVSLAMNSWKSARYVNYYTIDKEGISTRVDTEPSLPGIAEIRSVYLPESALPDDPDADALTGESAPKPDSVLTYGGIRNSNRLHVMEWDAVSTVEIPEHWTSYNGIDVDAHYVWLFGKGGIACATHASMVKCRRGKIARPSWITHDFDQQLNAPEVANLCPCSDGTLILSMLDQTYTADYEIRRKTNRIVTRSWVKRGGKATQVVKMPIPCWSVLENLNKSLSKE